MKVLAISSYGALGGAELASIEFLSHRPHDVDAAVLLVEDGPLRGRLEPLGLPIWAAGDRYDGRPTALGMGASRVLWGACSKTWNLTWCGRRD